MKSIEEKKIFSWRKKLNEAVEISIVNEEKRIYLKMWRNLKASSIEIYRRKKAKYSGILIPIISEEMKKTHAEEENEEISKKWKRKLAGVKWRKYPVKAWRRRRSSKKEENEERKYEETRRRKSVKMSSEENNIENIEKAEKAFFKYRISKAKLLFRYFYSMAEEKWNDRRERSSEEIEREMSILYRREAETAEKQAWEISGSEKALWQRRNTLKRSWRSQIEERSLQKKLQCRETQRRRHWPLQAEAQSLCDRENDWKWPAMTLPCMC